MTDFATLVLAADSRGLKSGEAALDSFAGKAGKTESTVVDAMSGIDTASKKTGESLADMAVSAGKSAGEVGKIRPVAVEAAASIDRIGAESMGAISDIARLEAQIHSLAASVDPVYASSKRYESALEQLNAALDAGVISQGRYNVLLAQTERAYLGAPMPVKRLADSVQNVGKQSIFAGHQSRMMAMQLSQVAQQASATGNWVQALAIQLPDLTLGFGTIGIAAGVVAGALLPVVANMVMSGDTAKELKDTMDNLEDSMKSYEQSIKDASQPIDDLIGKFGDQADAAQKVYEALRKIKEIEFYENLKAAQDAVAETLGGLQASVDRWQDASFMPEFARPEAIAMMRTEAALLGEEFGITVLQANRINTALDELAAANGPREAADAARRLGDEISRAHDEGSELTPEMVQIQKEAYKASVEAMRFSQMLGDSIENANGLASAVGTIADQALRAAQNLSSLEYGKIQNEYGSGADMAQREFLRNRPNVTGTIASGAGGYRKPAPKGRSGGAKKTDTMTDQMRDASRIYDETRTAAERYRKELADLDELQKMGYLSADTYSRAVAKVGEEYQNASEAGQFFNQISEDLKNGILDAIVEGGNLADTFESLAKSIARAALEAALFGSGPFAGASGGGKSGGSGLLGGLFSGLFGGLFSFDGGGSTGSGSRSGGVDGKGGFPAILHPNETVVDHSRGQGGGGSMHVTIGVSADNNGNLKPFVEDIARREASSTTGAAMKNVPKMVDSRNKTSQTRGVRA